MTKRSPFKYFKTSPEIIRLAVMLYVRFPLSVKNVDDLLQECNYPWIPPINLINSINQPMVG
jgi:transposase-like protein